MSATALLGTGTTVVGTILLGGIGGAPSPDTVFVVATLITRSGRATLKARRGRQTLMARRGNATGRAR